MLPLVLYRPLSTSEEGIALHNKNRRLYLYMWGGRQRGLPWVHNSEEKKSMSSVMEVCHLPSGRWEQKHRVNH